MGRRDTTLRRFNVNPASAPSSSIIRIESETRSKLEPSLRWILSSLGVIHKSMNPTNIDPNVVLILDKVHGFYRDAWQQLIWFAGALLGILGILVPILNQWYQRHSFQTEKESLRSDLVKELQSISATAREELANETAEQFASESKKLPAR